MILNIPMNVKCTQIHFSFKVDSQATFGFVTMSKRKKNSKRLLKSTNNVILLLGAQHEGGKLGRRGSGGKEGTPVKSRGFSPSGVEHVSTNKYI